MFELKQRVSENDGQGGSVTIVYLSNLGVLGLMFL